MQRYSIKKAIDIPEYKITTLLKETDKEVHLLLEPYKRKAFICSFCNQVHKKGYHSYIKTKVRDLPIFGKAVYLHVIKRRFLCPQDHKIHLEYIRWIKKWSRVTNRFAVMINRLTGITTNQEAGWFLNMDDETIYRIDKEKLEEVAKERLEPPPCGINLSIDEVSYRKYHRYLTNVVDVDKRMVIWNEKGRKAKVLDKYYQAIGKEGRRKIETVALDGARNYIASTNRYAVNAIIVYDRFHVIQKLNWAIDMTRKYELRKARKNGNNELVELINCKQRFILLKTRSKLTGKQSEYLERLCKINEPIYKAMLLKESFLQIYNYESIKEAQNYLIEWIQQALGSSLKFFEIIAKSFKEKMKYIINWFIKKVSSSISEGINNKIKRLKRMAYGYKDIEYFKLKIHQHCGLLNPRLFPQ